MRGQVSDPSSRGGTLGRPPLPYSSQENFLGLGRGGPLGLPLSETLHKMKKVVE